MNKIKKLTWFAFFYTVVQYVRERRFFAYFLGTALNCLLPCFFYFLNLKGHIGCFSFVLISFITRILFAPLDEFVSEDFSFSNLRSFPLSLQEKLYVRIICKVIQLSEWIFFILLFMVFFSQFSLRDTILLTISTVFCIELGEEIIFYFVHLFKNVKMYMISYVVSCVSMIVLIIYFRKTIAFDFIHAFLINIIVSVTNLILIIYLCKNTNKHCIVSKPFKQKIDKIPFSTIVIKKYLKQNSIVRLLCFDFICLFKLNPMNLISALAYFIVFSVLESSGDYLYILTQYFIVDLFFLIGFNSYGDNDDTYGLVLMSTLRKKILIISKNIFLISTTLFFSTVITIIFGFIFNNNIKTIILTLVANVFCICVMTLISSIVAIKHFHLSDSKKKYTIQNILIMIVSLITCSTVTAFLFADGFLSSIILIFVIMISCISIFFSLIDVTMLENLFNNNLKQMIYSIRNK